MRYFAMVATGAILWGCWPFFLRSAGLPGIQNALLALLVMAVPAPFLVRKEALRNRRATGALMAMGLADAANVALYFAAVERGPVAVAVLTHYFAPLLVALLAPWVLREHRMARPLLGAPVTLVGLGLLVWRPGESFSGWTAALGSASALFFAINIFATKEATRAWSPLAITALHSVISVAVLLLVFGRSAIPPALDTAVLWVATGGVLCGLLGTLLFNTGLRRVPTAAASALTYLEPVTASLLGWGLFHEALGPWGLLGGMMVLAAGAWVALEPRKAEAPLPVLSGNS